MSRWVGAEYGATLHTSYDVCRRLASEHYENFPVASWLVPAAMRPHVAAIYAFARTADDFADEGSAAPADRLRLLDAWRAHLHGQPFSSVTGLPAATPAIFTALHDTIGRCDLDVTLFDDLLSAFEQDVTVRRYETWDDVLDYCRRSANPVGRLVLSLAGVHTAEAFPQSDAVCTALQLTNFWQDFGRDHAVGRLYVPREVLERHGARQEEVAQGPPTAPWRAVFQEVVARTAALFREGREVSEWVRGRLRYELRATWFGGTTVLDRTAALRQHSFDARPSLTRLDATKIALQAFWRPDRRRR